MDDTMMHIEACAYADRESFRLYETDSIGSVRAVASLVKSLSEIPVIKRVQIATHKSYNPLK